MSTQDAGLIAGVVIRAQACQVPQQRLEGERNLMDANEVIVFGTKGATRSREVNLQIPAYATKQLETILGIRKYAMALECRAATKPSAELLHANWLRSNQGGFPRISHEGQNLHTNHDPSLCVKARLGKLPFPCINSNVSNRRQRAACSWQIGNGQKSRKVVKTPKALPSSFCTRMTFYMSRNPPLRFPVIFPTNFDVSYHGPSLAMKGSLASVHGVYFSYAIPRAVQLVHAFRRMHRHLCIKWRSIAHIDADNRSPALPTQDYPKNMQEIHSSFRQNYPAKFRDEHHPPGSLILLFLLRTLNEWQFEDHDNAMQYHKPNTFTTISWPAEGHILIYLSPSVEFVLRFQNPDEGNYHVPMSDDSYLSPPFKSPCHHICVPLIETIHTDDGKYTFTKIKSRWALSLSRLRSSSVLFLRMRPEYKWSQVPEIEVEANLGEKLAGIGTD
ncbi:hypothetical protein HCDG_06562 [Histoplasma capsulatum H143]|uniref:Uncharacterized protein n=1 Tax=Ajellomyces capsulatus (strain H143) TaxID=544712 RepID=C6HK31_AJECH|nr:hypothetical protein HCDG_06562 [Histoplasma capsulatum H143]